MFRSLALIAVWSHDRWLDVNHEDPELRDGTTGPNDFEFVLLSATPEPVEEPRIAAAMRELRVGLLHDYDGHAELHSHAELDDAAWASFVEAARWPLSGEALRADVGPVVANDLLTLEDATSMWKASGAKIRYADLRRAWSGPGSDVRDPTVSAASANPPVVETIAFHSILERDVGS